MISRGRPKRNRESIFRSNPIRLEPQWASSRAGGLCIQPLPNAARFRLSSYLTGEKQSMRRFRAPAVLAFLLLGVTSFSYAQNSASGDIRGTVTDATGSVLAGAHVSV